MSDGKVTRRSVLGASAPPTEAESLSSSSAVMAHGTRMSVVVIDDLTALEKYVTAWEDLAAAAYECVAPELVSYITVGNRMLILDTPLDQGELARISVVITQATNQATKEAQNDRVVTAISDRAGGAASWRDRSGDE